MTSAFAFAFAHDGAAPDGEPPDLNGSTMGGEPLRARLPRSQWSSSHLSAHWLGLSGARYPHGSRKTCLSS